MRHGDSQTGKRARLYRCWSHMIERAKHRKNCEVCPAWLDYVKFKAWALANGYDDAKSLCRTGDTGNYQPDNVRWDTQKSNLQEAHAMHFKFTLKGELVEVYNLREFCRNNELHCGHMSDVHSGKRKSHKGYSKWLDTNPSA